MSALIMKGAPVAAAICERTAAIVRRLEADGVKPCLALVRIGERYDDLAYEKGIVKRCAAAGIELRRCVLPEEVDENQLIYELCKLSEDAGVHGILCFMPMPGHINETAVRGAIAPEKDVDGVTEGSAAGLYSGSGRGFAPCTARAVIELLRFYDIPLPGRRAAVFGRSTVIGRPAAMLLMQEDATVTLCHSRTAEPESIAREADIIVAAVGKAKALGKAYFRPEQTVIDVGINFNAEGKMCGDTDFDAASSIVKAITPVPGGVGAVTTAVLALHTAEAAEKYMMTKGE